MYKDFYGQWIKIIIGFYGQTEKKVCLRFKKRVLLIEISGIYTFLIKSYINV